MITLISLAGVAIGVMVLIVVLSVFGGFEKLVKDRVLSYTPHIILERAAPWPDPEENPDFNIEEDWRTVERSMSSLKGVESAYALVNDFILLDRNGAVAPASMQAIDTTNELQLRSLEQLIKAGDGTADMGLGETAVISSLTAEKFKIRVGDTIQIHTNRNLQQLQPAMDRIGADSAWETYSEPINFIIKDIKDAVKPAGDHEAVAILTIQHLHANNLQSLSDSNLRNAEKKSSQVCKTSSQTALIAQRNDQTTVATIYLKKAKYKRPLSYSKHWKMSTPRKRTLAMLKILKTLSSPKTLK